MAISIVNGNRGTATEKTSDQTLTLTPNGDLAAGNYALLAVVIDNTSTSEGQTTDLSVTDNGPGATWVRLREQTEANTAALTGVTCALFMAHLRYPLTTAHTVSIAIAANSTAKGAGLAELSVAAGSQLIEPASGDTGANAPATTTYSVALAGFSNIPCLYVGMAAAEEELDTAVTLDAAYTALGFGSIGSGTGGANITNVRARVGTLANTSTGDTFNQTGLTSADRATILVRLEEYTPPFIADPVSINLASDEVDAVYHRQSEKRNSSGFMRVSVIAEPPPFIADPVSVNLATDTVDAIYHRQSERRNSSGLLRIPIPWVVVDQISVNLAVDQVDAVYHRQSEKKNSSGLLRVPIVEELQPERLTSTTAAIASATATYYGLGKKNSSGFIRVPLSTEEPPPPPPPPAYPTSPPPPRLGGASAW